MPAGSTGTWNGESIEFWCIQLNQTFGFGNTYTDYVAAPENIPVLTALGQLFTLAHASALSDADHSAAFQLAIWELVYDGEQPRPDERRLFRQRREMPVRAPSPRAGSRALARTVPDTWNLTLLTSASHQDFVTFGKPFGFKRSRSRRRSRCWQPPCWP